MIPDWDDIPYSTNFCNPKTDFLLPELTPKHFSFNSLAGACPACQGLGSEGFFDPELVIPDQNRSLDGGAIAPWRKATKRMQSYYNAQLNALAKHFGVSIEMPYAELPAHFKEALLFGTGDRAVQFTFGEKIVEKPFEGIIAQLENTFQQTESEFTRTRLKGFQARTKCASSAVERDSVRKSWPSRSRTLTNSDLNIHEFCALTIARREALRRKHSSFQAPAGCGDRSAERNSKPAHVSGGRRTWIPDSESGKRYALGRRSSADPTRDADRFRAGWCSLCAGRTEHWSAPTRQRSADRDIETFARPRKYGGCRRT